MPSYDDAIAALNAMQLGEQQLQAEILNIGNQINQHVQAHTDNGPQAQQLYARFTNLMSLKDKHREWGRKLHGVIMGYSREMQTGTKNVVKGRTIGFDRADVTVGTNEVFAKAVQHKHTVSPENSAVNDMIAKAANQLTGESGETPLHTQRKIIDVMINDPTNWWPFDLQDFNNLPPDVNLNDGVIHIDQVKQRGAQQILTQLNKYKQGKSGLNLATKNSLANIPPFVQGPFLQRPQGSGQRTSAIHPIGNQGHQSQVLTIKIVYGQPRNFAQAMGQTVTVSKMVWMAYNRFGTLHVEYLQHS